MLCNSDELVVFLLFKDGNATKIDVANVPSDAAEVALLVTQPPICFEPHGRHVDQKVLASILDIILPLLRWEPAVEREVNAQAQHSPSRAKLDEPGISLHHSTTTKRTKQTALLLHVAYHAHLLVQVAQRLLRGSSRCLVSDEGVESGGTKNVCCNPVRKQGRIDRPDLLLQFQLESAFLRITAAMLLYLVWTAKLHM